MFVVVHPIKIMDKCRLCLKSSKKLRSIFDKEDGVVYIDMITSISNVKISRDDKTTELCSSCRKKLKESYDFKNMIEMTNFVISEDKNFKRINFCNLDEIKIKVEIDTKKEINKSYSSMWEDYISNGEEFLVNDTLIKKIAADDIVHNEESLNVRDYVRLFKDEPDEDGCYDDDRGVENDYKHSDHSDDEYLPQKSTSRKEKVRKKKDVGAKGKENKATNRPNKYNMVAQRVLIKPVYLEDIGIVRTPVQMKKRKPKETTYKKPVQMCNFCGKMTVHMKSHMLTHTGKRTHKCDRCEKAFYNMSYLRQHQKKHEQHRQYKCEQCVATFYRQETLKRHMLVHSEEKKHMCQFCNKSFKRHSTLKRHELTHNSANRSVQCDRCSMTFFCKAGLKNHLRVHTGERPFRCEICSQGYSYKHDFNRHCFKKHGVFLKRRSVRVMNEEVLRKEMQLMRSLFLRLRGADQGDDPFKEFEGPQGYIGLQQAIKLLETNQLPVDVH